VSHRCTARGRCWVANGFDLADFLDRFDYDAGAFSLVCYGPTVQDDPQDPLFDIAPIWAKEVYDDWIAADEFSPLRTQYQDAADGWEILGFAPHDDDCDCPE